MEEFSDKNSGMSYLAFDIVFQDKKSRKNLIKWISQLKEENTSIFDMQFIKRNSIFSENHLKSAIWHAWKAFINGYAISNSISIEFLLYLSAQRQISKAMKYFGIEEFENKVSLVIFLSNRDQNSLESIKMRLKKQFGTFTIKEIEFSISDEKLKSLFSFYGYESKTKKDDFKDPILSFEKYLMSSVSNLVFEG